jgi:hypothetical protein
MRKLLFSLFVLSFVSLCAQNANDDPRGWKIAPQKNLKSLTVIGLVEVRKEPKPDSMFTEVSIYGEDGRLDSYSYRTILDKSTYFKKIEYNYWDGGFDAITEVNGAVSDSAIVRRDTAWVYSRSGRLEHLYAGDSVREYATVNGARVFRSAHALVQRDSFWDYRNAGNFSTRTIATGKTTDTIRYVDANAKVLVMIVNYYSESRHIIQSEYYNFGVKNFIFMRYAYNENMDMAYYMLNSRRGRPSYTVKRKFDENGLLTEETIEGTRKSEGILIKKYIYSYYS